MTFSFTLIGRTPDGGPSPPRTKKNSPMIVRGMKHPVLLPSQAYTDWLRDILKSRQAIHEALVAQGATLPIRDTVSVRAIISRDRNVGDWLGFMQAVGDALQCSIYRCQRAICGMKFYAAPVGKVCGCGSPVKQTRKGLGVIVDDKQIAFFAGVPLELDRVNPRVEIELAVLESPQASLFADVDEEVLANG
jgi:hypothetical protein